MSGFETTNIAAQTIKPTEILGGLADLQNKFNQNKLFQAKTIAGQYLAQSTGPDGQPDMANFSAYLSGDKRTAPYVPEILEAAQTIRRGGINANQEQQNLANSGYQNMQNDDASAYSAAYSAAKGANPTGDPSTWDAAGQKASLTALTRGAQTGRYGPNGADSVAKYAGNGSFTTNSARMAIINGQGGAGSQEALTGKPEEKQAGGYIANTFTNPYSGTSDFANGNAAKIQKTPSPDTLIQRTATVLPNNQPGSTSLGAVSPGPVATAPIPGSAEAQSKLAENGADQIVNVRKAYSVSRDNETLLDDMVAAKKDFRSGVGSTKTSEFITEANRLIPGLNLSPTDTPSQQVFNKVATQYAAANARRLGLSDTDAQTMIARIASPNTDISDEAIHQLSALGKGAEKKTQLQNLMTSDWLDKEKHGDKAGRPENYQTFVDSFNKNVDPRILQEPYMTPLQKQQMYKSMTPDQQEKYTAQKAKVLGLAKKYGVDF